MMDIKLGDIYWINAEGKAVQIRPIKKVVGTDLAERWSCIADDKSRTQYTVTDRRDFFRSEEEARCDK